MSLFFDKPELEVQDAKWLAQFIAFAPFVFQVSHCLKKFKIFDALELNKSGLNIVELKSKISLPEGSLSILLDAAESAKLIKQDAGLYTISQIGHFLNSDQITNVNFNFTKDVCYSGLSDLDKSLETCQPVGLQHLGPWKTIYEGLTQLKEPAQKSWSDFDHFYSDESFPRALPILFKHNPTTILDIGSNTGKFAQLCLQYSDTVKVTLVDHPGQLEAAKKRLRDLNLIDRATFVPMDLLDHNSALPGNHDLIWMSQFLDCFQPQDIVQILKRCRQSMSQATRLYIMETFTDRQKFPTAKFCLDMTSLYFTCLANGHSRMYRATDFYEFIKQAELNLKEEQNNIRLSHTLLRCSL